MLYYILMREVIKTANHIKQQHVEERPQNPASGLRNANREFTPIHNQEMVAPDVFEPSSHASHPFPELARNIKAAESEVAESTNSVRRRSSEIKLSLLQDAIRTVASPAEEKAASYVINQIPENRRPKDIAEVVSKIRSGEDILREILHGEPVEPTLDNVVAFQWALFARATHKEQGFVSGVISLEDPDRKVFNFLNSYEKKYKRSTSSHFKEAQIPKMKNMGIDIPGVKFAEGPLPAGKRHILFGALEGEKTFIKWEDYGTKINQVAPHLLSYFRKSGSFGQDAADKRRENTPKDVERHFDELLKLKKIILSKSEKKDIKVNGLQSMLELAETHGFRDEFLSHSTLEGMDNLAERKGNEVFFSNADLLNRRSAAKRAWTPPLGEL